MFFIVISTLWQCLFRMFSMFYACTQRDPLVRKCNAWWPSTKRQWDISWQGWSVGDTIVWRLWDWEEVELERGWNNVGSAINYRGSVWSSKGNLWFCMILCLWQDCSIFLALILYLGRELWWISRFQGKWLCVFGRLFSAFILYVGSGAIVVHVAVLLSCGKRN